MTTFATITAAELRKLQAQKVRRVKQQRRTLADMRDDPRKARKYHNEPVDIDGMHFDSTNEYRHWCELVLRAKAREIFDLQRQVAFELAPAAVYGGTKHRPMVYLADFVYREGAPDGPRIVVDVKGMRTDAYRLKRHLMATVHGIDIREVHR